MHVTAPGKLLKPVVKAAAAIAPEKDDRQILRNLLLTATSDGLEFAATDLRTNVWLHIPANGELKILKEGSVVVQARNLDQIVRRLASYEITLASRRNGSQFAVRGGKAKHHLPVEATQDFPVLRRFSKLKPSVRVNGAKFMELVKRTAYCAHDNASRFLMHGVLIEVETNRVRLVATNGQRLAVASMSHAGFVTGGGKDIVENPKMVLDAKALPGIKSILSGPEDEFELQFMANGMNARSPLGEAHFRSLAGKFPPYRRGIPESGKKIEFTRSELIEFLSHMTLIKNPGSAYVEITFSRDQGMVARSYVEGEGATQVNKDIDWEDDSLTITTNPIYMLEAVKVMKGENLDLEVLETMRPTVLRERCKDGMECFVVYAVVAPSSQGDQ